MAHSKTTGGTTAKSHKTRKTDSVPAPGGETSLVAIAPTTTEPPTTDTSAPEQRTDAAEGGSQPPTAVPGAAIAPLPEETVPQPVPDEKQWWYRKPDSKARAVVAKILVMDAAGHKDAEIAKKLKTTAATISSYRYIAKRNGWLRHLDNGVELVDIEAELALNIDRKIVRNVDASLDGRMTNWQTHEMTIAAAKGRGIFKGDTGQRQDGELSVVAIQIAMPPLGAADQKIDEASVGGTPAYVEGDVLAEEGKQS